MKVLRKFSYYNRYSAEKRGRPILWAVRINTTCLYIYSASLTGAKRKYFFLDSKKTKSNGLAGFSRLKSVQGSPLKIIRLRKPQCCIRKMKKISQIVKSVGFEVDFNLKDRRDTIFGHKICLIGVASNVILAAYPHIKPHIIPFVNRSSTRRD